MRPPASCSKYLLSVWPPTKYGTTSMPCMVGMGWGVRRGGGGRRSADGDEAASG
jgi:hypothetical protein